MAATLTVMDMIGYPWQCEWDNYQLPHSASLFEFKMLLYGEDISRTELIHICFDAK